MEHYKRSMPYFSTDLN